MTLPYPSSPEISENIADSISRIEQNLEYLDGQITTATTKQVLKQSVDMTTNGLTTITGAGFTPTSVIVMACETTGKSQSWGMATSSTSRGCTYKTYARVAGSDTSLVLYLLQSAGASSSADLSSFNSDGAVFDFTAGGAVGLVMDILYIFMK